MLKVQKSLLVLLGTLLGVILLAVLVFTLSFSSLAAPTQPIPKANFGRNQLALQNIQTKLRASALGLITSRNGTLAVTLSQEELNALIYQALTSRLNGDMRLLGSTTTITPAKTINSDLAVQWRGYTLGLHANIKPVVLSNGRVQLLLSDLKLGKLPLPKTYLLNRLKPHLPRAVTITQQPVGLMVNPNAMIDSNYLPIFINPRISVQSITLYGNNLQLVARVLLRIP